MGSEIFSGPFFLGGLFLTYPNLTSLVSIMITLFHMILDPYLEYPGGGLGSWSKSYGFTGSTQFQTLGFWGLL